MGRAAVVSLVGGYVDLRGRRVVRGDEIRPLTGQEAALLARLVASPGRCVARETLLVDVLGYHPDVQTRALDAAMRRLRVKIEADPSQPRLLLTVRGVGYVFQPLSARARPMLVGRADLRAQLDRCAGGLTTLVGPAGVGKTALARAWAAEHAPIAELSGVRERGGLLHRVADALELAPDTRPEDELLADIGHALAARPSGALILDNGEHLLDPLRACCTAWMAAAPATTVLVTSREALRLPGERVLPVPPLPVADAVHLLRLRAAEERVELHDDEALVALVERLDRLPLAIEIAAGRTRTMSPRRMLQRRHWPALLRGQRRADAPHQTSLEATLSWSWDLSSPAERRALTAAARFRGPFGLDALEAVSGDAPLEAVESLQRKHLLRREGPRFALPGVIRGFVRARDAGALDFARRHGAWSVAEARAGRVRVDELAAAHEALAHDEPALATDAALLALPTLYRRGPRATHAALVEACAAHADGASPLQRGCALVHRAALRRSRGAVQAADTDARQALALAEAEGDPTLALHALIARADIQRYAGRLDDAEALYARAGAACADVEPADEARLLRAWANLLLDRGALDRAEALNARALHLLRLCGDREAEAVLLGNMGVVAMEAARDVEARAALERALQLHTALGDRRHRAVVGSNLATLEHAVGALDRAAERATACLAEHRWMGNRRFEGFARYILAAVAHEQGRLEHALDHIGAAIALWQAVGERRFLGYGLCRLAMVEAERGATAAASAAVDEARARLADPRDLRFAEYALRLADGHLDPPLPPARSTFARISIRLLQAAARR